MSLAAKRHLSRVAELGCIACRLLGVEGSPAEVHHPRFAAGAGQRASDFLAIPLCPEHHRGPRGVHGDKSILRQLRVDEPALLAFTLEELFR